MTDTPQAITAAQIAEMRELIRDSEKVQMIDIDRPDGQTEKVLIGRTTDGSITTRALGDYQHLPKPHIFARQSFYDLRSFIDYVLAFASPDRSRVFIDVDPTGTNTFAVAACDIDYHDPTDNSVGECEHTALIALGWSESFRRVLNLGMQSQDDFADFVEDNPALFATPSTAEMMELAIKFRATQTHKFTRIVNRENGDLALEHSVDTTHPETLKVPRNVDLLLPILPGDYPQVISARFVYKVRDGSVRMGLRIIGLQSVRDAVIENARNVLTTELSLPVHLTV